MSSNEEAAIKRLKRSGQMYASAEEALQAIREKQNATLRKRLERSLKGQVEDEEELARIADQLEIQITEELKDWNEIEDRIVERLTITGKTCIGWTTSGLIVSISPHLGSGEAQYQEDWIRSKGFLAGDLAVIATKNHEVEVRMLLDAATDKHVIRISEQDARELDVRDGLKVVLAMTRSTEGKASLKNLARSQMLEDQYHISLLERLGIKKRSRRPPRKIVIPRR